MLRKWLFLPAKNTLTDILKLQIVMAHKIHKYKMRTRLPTGNPVYKQKVL